MDLCATRTLINATLKSSGIRGFHVDGQLRKFRGSYDLVVVGGGIVGCASARETKLRHPNMKIAIVEKENDLAKHQTGHNSGVVHAGIYYKPGSVKAKLCVQGLKLSYEYFAKHDVPHKKVGKLVVAHGDEEVKRLNDLFDRAQKNGCPDIKLVEKDALNQYEPECRGDKALWSPWTGIVDWALVCQNFAGEFQKMGGDVFLNFEVISFDEVSESTGKNELMPIRVHSETEHLEAKYVLTCGGLHSDRLAVMTGCSKDPCIVPFRGEYLLLNQRKASLITTNVYPVPDPKLPFLGVHFTPRMNGDVWLGPNAVLALAREGYRWTDVNFKDICELLRYPGFYKMAPRYLKPGITEAVKSLFPGLTVKECRKYFSEIKPKDVKRGPSGVRAQALDNEGHLVDDFVFDSSEGSLGSRIIHCRNVPSPAATSSLAIAKYIVDKMEKDFRF